MKNIPPKLKKVINQQAEEMRKNLREKMFFDNISLKNIDENLKMFDKKLNGMESYKEMLDQFRDDEK